MLKMERCKRCGKFFIPGAEHLYKLIKDNKTCYYCCYTCWRKDGGDDGRRYI